MRKITSIAAMAAVMSMPLSGQFIPPTSETQPLTVNSSSGALVNGGLPSISLGSLPLTAGSFNGLVVTPTSGTFTLTLGKTFAVGNSLTLTGIDGSTLNVGSGGTLGSNAYTSTAYVPQTTQVNGHALSGNVTVSASDINTGTLPIGQVPTGTTSTTVALGNAPAAAQAAAISAAEANAATIYIPKYGSLAITGNLGANNGVNWEIFENTGAAWFDGGDWHTDGDGDTIQTGTVQANSGVIDQYGNPIIDSSDQLHYGYGNGILTDTEGQLYWSSWDYSNSVFLGNEGQVYAANGAQVLDYNADLTVSTITSDRSAIHSDGGGDLYATNFYGSFVGDGSSLNGTASGFTVGYATYADNLVGDVSYADEAGYAANAGEAAGLSSNLPLDEVSGVDSSYYTPLNNSVDSSAGLVSQPGADTRYVQKSQTVISTVATDITCATGTTPTNTSFSITLTPGTYDFTILVEITTASTTAGINSQLLCAAGDTRSMVALGSNNYSTPSMSCRMYGDSSRYMLSAFGDAPATDVVGSGSGRWIVAATTTYYFQVCQRNATDAGNPPILKAGSYIRCAQE